MSEKVPPAYGRRLGYLEAVCAACLWGSSGIFSVHLFRMGVPPESVALLRSVVGALALVAVFGVSTHTAATLLVCAGDNPHRLHSSASFAALCGVNPVPASSGKTRRHRLNRAGNRQANSALWRIAMTRLAYEDRTKAYLQRRTTEGLSKREIIRCLKRAIARELYPIIVTDLNRLDPNH